MQDISQHKDKLFDYATFMNGCVRRCSQRTGTFLLAEAVNPGTAGEKQWIQSFPKEKVFNEKFTLVQMGIFWKGAGFLREALIFFCLELINKKFPPPFLSYYTLFHSYFDFFKKSFSGQFF